MAKSKQPKQELPNALIESLKSDKEEQTRIENIQKIITSLLDKQNNLSEEQTNQLKALKASLESDTLQTLEDKAEANSIASDTLGLLSDIRDNTEDLKFDFSDGTKGIFEKIFVFGRLLLTTFIGGFIKGMASIFKAPTLVKLFKFTIVKPLKFLFSPVTKLFTYMSNVFRALGDVYKKAGTNKFLKGNTFKILGKRGIKFFRTIFVQVKRVVDFVKMIGGKFKAFALAIKGVGVSIVSKLLSPFKEIGRSFKDIKSALGVLSKGKGPFAGIMSSVRSIGGLLGKFRPLFRALGFALGNKLFFPVLMLIDAVRGIFSSLKTSEFTNPFAKAIDAVFTAIGYVAGGFLGGILDLIKDAISWVAEKLGFEGFSEFLDSFSIREMVEEGMGSLAEMFSMLFTKVVPALIAGVAAAVNPLSGQTFAEAFDEEMYGATSGGEAGAKGDQRYFDLRGQRDEVKEKIRNEQMELDSGDTKGGMLGFRYDRAERLADLAAELEAIDAGITLREREFKAKNSNIDQVPNATGAQMEATQNDTLNAQESKVNITPIISNTDASTSTSTVVHTSTNQTSHIDRTMGMGLGNMLLQ